jgi:hypothetical protein
MNAGVCRPRSRQQANGQTSNPRPEVYAQTVSDQVERIPAGIEHTGERQKAMDGAGITVIFDRHAGRTQSTRKERTFVTQGIISCGDQQCGWQAGQVFVTMGEARKSFASSAVVKYCPLIHAISADVRKYSPLPNFWREE